MSAPSEMAFVSLLARSPSFSAAARELELSTAAVSKRLAQMEARLGVQLLHRTTRRISLTPEGEVYLQHARRILADIDDMERLVASARTAPQGLLRVNATLGFGRSHIAPLISAFARRHPEVQVQLQLSVDPPALSEDAFDVCVRFGEPPDARVIARRLAPNRRLLCAAPAYLEQQGVPRAPEELLQHRCICIVAPGGRPITQWRFASEARPCTVEVEPRPAFNDGPACRAAALAGHGLVRLPFMALQDSVARGDLVRVLPEWYSVAASLNLVYPASARRVPRVRVFIDWMRELFADLSPQKAPHLHGLTPDSPLHRWTARNPMGGVPMPGVR